MIDDLKADTNAIAALNIQRIDRLQMYDSLSKAILKKTYSEKGADFYYWGRNISRRVLFFSADGTMQQLKNSGGLRLISDRYIADKIITYDVLYRSISFQQQLEEVHLNEYRTLAGRIFDAAIFNEMTRSSTSMIGNNPNLSSFFEKPPGNPQLKDSSPASLNELANILNYWAAASLRLFDLLEHIKKRAVELIDLIRNEYHLK
jgi:hypothetical protein